MRSFHRAPQVLRSSFAHRSSWIIRSRSSILYSAGLGFPSSPFFSTSVGCREASIPTSASTPTTPERKSWRPAPHRNPEEPVYELHFTCKVCKTRSGHTVSKQGYHAGTVLITCSGCKNKHLISDHLKIFSDTPLTLDDILKQTGQTMKTGTLDEHGDVEYWPDVVNDKKEP